MDEYGTNHLKLTKTTLNSPFLNFDPAILKSPGSQFVIPEGQGETRGKMEMSFFKIGSAIGIGGSLGLLNGTFTGLRETRETRPLKNIWRTQMLNFAAKHGAASAQAFGTAALLFSLYDTAITYGRGVDDELNMCVAGVATGMTYTYSHGYLKSLRGGVVGLGLVGTYLLLSNKTDVITNLIS